MHPSAAMVLQKRGVHKILSGATWEVGSDHVLKLAPDGTRGTRGSARRGKDKTQKAKAPVLSQGSANRQTVA